MSAAVRRIEQKRARSDTREWVVKRRERTRQLIELGGLVAKAGLVELSGDDRAVIYGALLSIAYQLKGDDRETVLALMRRRGKRAFANEKEGAIEPAME